MYLIAKRYLFPHEQGLTNIVKETHSGEELLVEYHRVPGSDEIPFTLFIDKSLAAKYIFQQED